MKKSFNILLCVTILQFFSSQSCYGRTWTGANGRTFEGELISADENFVVIRGEANQQTYRIALNALSKADVEFVKNAPKSQTSEKPITGDVTANTLQKLFRATKVSVDAEGGAILTYSFKAEGELLDFENPAGGAKIASASLQLEPGVTIKHKAVFSQGAKLTTRMSQTNWKGTYISTSEGHSVGARNYNAWLVELKSPVGAEKLIEAKFSSNYTSTGDKLQFFPIDWTLDSQRTLLKFDKFDRKDILLSLQGDNSKVGSFSFHGGSGGSRIRELTISGKLDPSWLSTQQK